MRSLRLLEFGKKLEWQERPTPQVQGTQVLLAVKSCGVCHSDLHIWQGYYDIGAGERLYVRERGLKLPLTMGHEIYGEVVDIGDGVATESRVPSASSSASVPVIAGKRFLVYPWQGCGKCTYCRDYGENHCLNMRSVGMYQDGGYSDYVMISHPRYLVDIGSLPEQTIAPYACAGLTAYSAIKKAIAIPKGETIVVIGAGGVGLLGLQILPYLTQNPVIVVDVNSERLAEAAKLGPYTMIDSSRLPAEEAIRKICPQGVGAVIDFVGLAATGQLGFSLLKKNARLISAGLFGGAFPLPTALLAMKNVTIRGSYTGSIHELRELIALLARHRPKTIACHHYPLSSASDLLQKLAQGSIVGRCIVEPQIGH